MLMVSTIVVSKPVSCYVPRAHSYTLRMFFFIIYLFSYYLIGYCDYLSPIDLMLERLA